MTTWFLDNELSTCFACAEMNTSETWNYKSSHFCGNFACLGKPWCTEW